ncbi:AbiH family protein [Amylolactobacillus amylophilus]|uniref:Uncharacterized protein n=1 Tax=Amylolactobacillus amylophilus DSM 20533 = JCM 1125 TaxID=1423721 RepID=A0A1L6XCT7_9LACO|nr:AbiH family protein [Amylolactobacillus amylophilus]APT18783.1 hypothetical protein LA20533_05710 [Amylolactobacillus amylophilus DSM 20533 = JCM 1125]GED80870.1 hypothetical protein LAM01_13430 [Amylolactobacillus amylophilus]
MKKGKLIKYIVVIGNGLDLHHGLSSRYVDFYNSSSMSSRLKEEYDIVTAQFRKPGTWYDF